jgi:hypothetical protein
MIPGRGRHRAREFRASGDFDQIVAHGKAMS